MITKHEIENEFWQRIEKCRTQGNSLLNSSRLKLHLLGEKRLAELMREIPKGVTALDLSWNSLDELGAEALKTALQGIPKNITTLDLSNNGLDKLDLPALAKVLATIPNHVTFVHLGDNGFFINKSTKEIDAFLQQLGIRRRSNLSGNGESSLARALAPMALLTQENSTNNPRLPALPIDVAAHILSFLDTNHKPKNQIGFFQQQLKKTIETIEKIKSSKSSQNNPEAPNSMSRN
ncbi:hypothetical protein [Legionella waltersii]|uniref:Leucine-rich repeat-containing protein n=1 Tax=Legionella waltersii TaxID=66969 RepID=A0A0W1A1G4_9GAMM|nr:hypothetical protein [Legionella waltersii]KTD75198.1 leucine-rich repeat-containing protein [Legionella waltersii]SNV10441.1 Leucine-rich repeat-containing protein Substrate of the Dot/Icm secretion system [Legionella waltersii]